MELVHILASDQELVDAAVELSEHRAQPYLTQERKDQISRQMGYIFFELQQRNEIVLLEQPNERATA